MSTDDDVVVVNHVGTCVADLDRARTFYEAVLGFEVERELHVPDAGSGPFLSVEPPVGLTAVYLRRGSFVLELLHFDRLGNPTARPRPFNEPGLTHISLSVTDVEATAALAVDHGGELVTNLHGSVLVRDPDGQIIELLSMDYRRRIEAEVG